MKKLIVTATVIALCCGLTAQNTLNIHRSGSVIYSESVSDIDSITLQNNTSSSFYIVYRPTTRDFSLANVDSITFSDETTVENAEIYIVYNGSSVNITNPMSTQGVTITNSGANVVVTASA